jgi:hypothetical protein
MKKEHLIKQFIALVLLVLVLTSCTGTTETDPPVFLIAGVNNPGKPQLLLYRDDFLSDTKRFVLFKNKVKDKDVDILLSAPPIAFDIVDRTTTRTELVVLTREADGTSFLEFFDLRGIETPADFVETTAKQIALAKRTDLPTNIDICPTSVQVTRDGTVAILLNDPQSCGRASDIRLIFIDLVNNKYITQYKPSGAFPLSPAPPVLDQSGDSLYFLQEGATDTKLERVERNSFTKTTISASDITEINPSIKNNPRNQVDMIKQGSNILVLNPNSDSQSIYTVVPTQVNGEDKNIRTLGQTQKFIPDYTNRYSQVFILSSSRLIIHPDFDSTEAQNNVSGTVDATVGTINTASDFLYLAGTGIVSTLDLLDLDQNSTSIALETETSTGSEPNKDLAELINPTILTWVQGVATTK